jgi:hypothetical protein
VLAHWAHMPHYSIIVHGEFEVDDLAPQLFADDAAALAEAARIVRELKCDFGARAASWSIEVRNGERVVATIPFLSVD